MSKTGIKETKEIMIALNELLIFFLKRFKDGVQYSDFIAFYREIVADPEMKALITKAYEGYNKVPSEVIDIDVNEACELLFDQIAIIPKIVEALKKNP
jgi:hypothetical protein